MNMKTLSFVEFKHYCDNRKIRRVIYDTDNNSRITDAENCAFRDPLHICFCFEIIGFVDPPETPTIYLSSSVGAIGLNNVQKVMLDKFAKWDEARVYCKSGDHIMAYNLIIDY